MMTESETASASNDAATTASSATAETTSAAPLLFPCLEQPIKAYLTSSSTSTSSSSGRRRLVSHKDGTVVAKPITTSSTTAAEFFLLPIAGSEDDSGGGFVTIKSVLHGRYLSVSSSSSTSSNSNNGARSGARSDDDDNNIIKNNRLVSTIETEIAGPTEEWKLTKAVVADNNSRRQQQQNVCLLTNAATGVHLACCPDTGVLFTTTAAAAAAFAGKTEQQQQQQQQQPIQHELWSVEFITGELLFMSNPRLDVRIRCDLMGMLSLTPNWKGWEVWRFMESGVQGQIRINSWMHSQRYLTSNANGKATTISASALDKLKQQQQQPQTTDIGEAADESLWTVEAAPDKQGCILRSVAYRQRILACHKVVVNNNINNNNNAPPDLQLQQTNEDAAASSLPSPEETTVSNYHRSSLSSFSRSIASLRERTTTTQKPTETWQLFTEDELVLLQQEEEEKESTCGNNADQSSCSLSFVWHLEAAHSQRYSMSTAISTASNSSSCWSVGPDTTLTENRRQTQVIHLEQHFAGTNNDNIVTLFLEAQQQYLGSSPSNDGIVTLSHQAGESEHWWMQVGKSGGYTFQSKQHGGFLSYRQEEINIVPPESESNSTAAEEENGKKKANWSIAKLQKMAKDYNKKESVRRVLCTKQAISLEEDNMDVGTDYRPTHLWRLDPILPRAVSSSKIKTFAIGTSIAVGTTIAMPFACAGIIGLMGTEMGILANIVTVGLTSAEAIASVGVIGTTAAIVFREDGDSLAIVSDGDAVASDDESRHRHEVFLKRPFCNWRVW